jgi:hypothetical protein
MFEIAKIQLQPGGSNMRIDISHLSLKPGFYYLKVFSPTVSEITKLIIH